MTFRSFIAIALGSLIMAMSAIAKTGCTLYPSERVTNARRNIERYQWAKDIRDATVKSADVYARQPDDFLWNLVTPQTVLRGIHVNTKIGCPKCGHEIDKFGNYPWKCDVIGQPWKIECPNCHEMFPKNDFARYYQSGLDVHGVFDPNHANRSLLYNTEHPDPKDPLHMYGVDDGSGWVDGAGNNYRFIPCYNFWGSWNSALNALSLLRDAYLYTGNPIYAHKAGILLYRIAEFYPDMDYAQLGKNNLDSGDGNRGKIEDCIWECGVAQGLASSYDGVYPGLDDPQLLIYLSNKLGKPVTAADERALIEKNILHEIHDAILRGQIEGNEGMYQLTMAKAAICLDEPETTDNWLDWIFAPGNVYKGDRRGGHILELFDRIIDNDGMGNEASPSYNTGWRLEFQGLSDVLGLYPRYKGPRIVAFPKFRKMYETPAHMVCLEKFLPNIGDCNPTGKPGLQGTYAGQMAYAYRTFNDPEFAQLACYLNNSTSKGLRGDIFDAEPEEVAKKVDDVVKRLGPYTPKTIELPDYGLTLLRSGAGVNSRALTCYYGRNSGHGHKDTLNIELFGFGLSLMPDLGYPEYTGVNPLRFGWNANTISHNTVVVDDKPQAPIVRGQARFVVQGKGAAAAELFSDAAYPITSMYQRTLALIDVSDSKFYVVDIFRVSGGRDHVYSLHGAEGEVATEGLSLVSQDRGTLAGENVEFGQDIGDWKRNGWDNTSGYQYLYDIRRDVSPNDQPAITWEIVDTWHQLKEKKDIKLRVNLLNPPGEVILAHGNPPQNKPGNPKRLTYLLSKDENSQSTFVSVIEPYSGARCVQTITRTDKEDAVVIKVTLASGRVDSIVSSPSPHSFDIDGQTVDGRFAIISKTGDSSEKKLLVK